MMVKSRRPTTAAAVSIVSNATAAPAPLDLSPSDEREALTCTMADHSMSPRYLKGEGIVALKHGEARPGDYVLMHIDADGETRWVASKLVLSSPTRLRVQFLKPPTMFEIPRENVVAVHRIILGGDRMGARS